MIKLVSVLVSITILSGSGSAIPEQVVVFLKSKYKDPVITDISSEPVNKICGINIFTVYEREYANEDPLITDSWIYTGKNILPGNKIFEALKEVKFEPEDEKQAALCAMTILSVNNVYINNVKNEVVKKDKQYRITISGICSESHPFFRKKDYKKCTYRITLGNKEYKLTSE